MVALGAGACGDEIHEDDSNEGKSCRERASFSFERGASRAQGEVIDVYLRCAD